VQAKAMTLRERLHGLDRPTIRARIDGLDVGVIEQSLKSQRLFATALGQ
jgi:hypothetical protein